MPDPAPKPCKPVIDWDRDDDRHGGKRHDSDGRERRHDHRDDNRDGKGGWVKDFVLDLGVGDANRDLKLFVPVAQIKPVPSPARVGSALLRHLR